MMNHNSNHSSISIDDQSYPFNDLPQLDFNNEAILSLLEDPTLLPEEAALSLSPLLSSPYLNSAEDNFIVDTLISSTSDQSSPDRSPEQVDTLTQSMCAYVQTSQSQSEEEEPKAKKGRSRKRQRKAEIEENPDVSAVMLSREQLLHFTSQDLDMFARNLASSRPLTAAEERELKRQRRLIKNRESAQASRERKKYMVDELQAQINQLRADNSKMADQMDQLRNENTSLREEIKRLHINYGKGSDNDSKISFGDILTIKKPSTVDSNLSHKIKTAGVTLLIVLFSFGLFFNSLGENRQVSLPAHLQAVREQIPIVLPSTSLSNLVVEKINKGRQLTELTRYQNDRTPAPIQDASPQVASPSTTSAQQPKTTAEVMQEFYNAKRHDASPIAKRSNQTESSFSYRKVGTEQLIKRRQPVGKNANGEEMDTDSVGSIFMSEFANESTPTNGTELSPDAALTKWFNEHVDTQPNTAYLACSDVQQIIPPDAQAFDTKSPFFVSFLIPSEQVVTDPMTNKQSNVTLMMEITAQVVDIGVSRYSTLSASSSGSIPIVA